ncbi:hypothetical protein AB3S75_021248 [Citrus x aurantiifolia]
MSFSLYVLTLFLSVTYTLSSTSEVDILMQIKDSLDPENRLLTSWTPNADPCSSDSFDGVACDENGRVANISLQGKGLSGELPAAVGGLKSLTGLYLHFNALNGVIPKEIASLSELTDMYLNVNNLSGKIPSQIGNMTNLQVLQLCYNKLTGNIPTQLGSLRKLSVLALQYNQLTGAIPASLGDLGMLMRLDLSFNNLFGPVPVKLANVPKLEVLDLRNNSFSGNVPPALKRLNSGFQYDNNAALCGTGFANLKNCTASDHPTLGKPEPFEPNGLSTKDIPESAKLPANCRQSGCSSLARSPHTGVIVGVKEVCRRNSSPLISLEYSNGWDPLAKGQSGNGFSQEVLESFMFNLEEVERATQCFSEANLLGKSSFSATYKGILRDGSVVAVKCIAKTSCKSDEGEFLKGLKILTSLKHENLASLRGICCSKGRGSEKVLEWATRISVIKGIAKGISYLHGKRPGLVHPNLSAEKVLIHRRYNPLLSDSGLHKLLADDIVFSMLKASAAMGYLAPEYTTTGRFTEKSDIYAFGMIVFQILSGKCNITPLTRQAAESSKVEDFIDPNLEGKFSVSEASNLGQIALHCTHESPSHRPSIENVMQELSSIIGSS